MDLYKFLLQKVFIFLLLSPLMSLAQQKPAVDTSRQAASVVSDSFRKVTSDTSQQFFTDTSVSSLLIKIEQLTLTLNKVSGSLKRGFDTAAISSELPRYENLLVLIRDNIEYDYSQFNLRNLHIIKVLLIQMNLKTKAWQEELLRYTSKLNNITNEIRAITRDSIFHKMPVDTTLLALYMEKLQQVSNKWQMADSLQKKTLKRISLLQNRVTSTYIGANELSDEVDFRIRNYNLHIWSKEEPRLWEIKQSDYKQSYLGAIQTSFSRSFRVLLFYFELTWTSRTFNFIIAVLFFAWIFFNKRQIVKSGMEEILKPIHFATRSSILSALLILFTISPFFYQAPPAIYVELLWFLMLIVVTLLLWPDWSARFRRYWIGVVLLFVAFGVSNLLVQSSLTERWLLFVFNIVGILLGLLMKKEVKNRQSGYPKYVDQIMWIFLVANGTAILLNLFGRFTLAKFFANASVMSISLAMALHIIVELVMEALYLQLEAYKKFKLTSYMDFKQVRDKFKNLLTAGAGILWLLAFSWSLNIYDFIVEYSIEFLNNPIKLGSASFTFGSILIFFLVMWASTLIARLLTYFFGASNLDLTSTKREKVGSWILLARLGIITAGFFLAIVAAGIPLDRLALIIGALGVGIGFGLQNVVNNLVSGLILAFEKPMQVGDVIEVGTQTGTVKEIGMRSSKITTYEGSEIIVPNGDFISQQLINWTHSNTYRRIELKFGVAYGTDLKLCTKLLEGILNDHKDIVKQPPSSILIHEFADSAVNFRLLFWTNNFDRWVSIKSEVLAAVYDSFADHHIQIPFPQQDVHIKSIDGTRKEEDKEVNK